MRQSRVSFISHGILFSWRQSAVLQPFFPDGFAGRRLVDLACLEGGYSVEFARLGFGEVLGIEVRQTNIQRCEYVRQRVNMPNLRFAQDDVWNLAHYGLFDAIFCCGIFYHLDRPRQFLGLLADSARRAVLINTHFATADTNIAGPHELSEIEINEELPGRWFSEKTSADERRRAVVRLSQHAFFLDLERIPDRRH